MLMYTLTKQVVLAAMTPLHTMAVEYWFMAYVLIQHVINA